MFLSVEFSHSEQIKMSKSTNLFGIPNKAIEFLEENSIKVKLKNQFEVPKSEPLIIKGKLIHYGMFDDYYLYKYPLENGFASEFIQNNKYWINGPLIFLGLSIKTLKEKFDIKWSEEEIELKVKELI